MYENKVLFLKHLYNAKINITDQYNCFVFGNQAIFY